MCWFDGSFGTNVPEVLNVLSIFNEAWHFTACWTLFWVTMLKLLVAFNLQPNLLIRFLLLRPFVCLICKFKSLGRMYLPYPKKKLYLSLRVPKDTLILKYLITNRIFWCVGRIGESIFEYLLCIQSRYKITQHAWSCFKLWSQGQIDINPHKLTDFLWLIFVKPLKLGITHPARLLRRGVTDSKEKPCPQTA